MADKMSAGATVRCKKCVIGRIVQDAANGLVWRCTKCDRIDHVDVDPSKKPAQAFGANPRELRTSALPAELKTDPRPVNVEHGPAEDQASAEAESAAVEAAPEEEAKAPDDGPENSERRPQEPQKRGRGRPRKYL